jgi:hypothetical protein
MTMRSAFRLLTILGAGAACILASAAAPLPREEPAAIETPEARGVGRAVMSAELAAWGRERGSAEALRLAATILDEVPLRPGPDGDVDVEPVLSAAAFRRQAAELDAARAARDEIVVGGARRPQAPAAPPPPPPPPPPPAPPPPALGVRSSPFGAGPVSTIKRLASRESWSFDVDARGAEILRVAVVGDGDAAIDLVVRDAAGKILCADGLGDHYPVCTLAPRAPARLRIGVVNRGGVWTRVQVITN